MSKKLEKLKEINELIDKRINELETYIFLKNIPNPVQSDNCKQLIGTK